MPVMVFYKDKNVPLEAAKDVMKALSEVTDEVLAAKIEVRVVEPVLLSANANPVHIEVRFRDFGEYTDEQLQLYHDKAMTAIGDGLRDYKLRGKYSFYIVPSMPPRSIWAQGELGSD